MSTTRTPPDPATPPPDHRRLRLRIGPTGLGTVELDGRDISSALRGVDLSSRVGELTDATLHLLVVEVDADAAVRLHLPDAARALLVEHGWTPPADTDGSQP